LLYFEKKGKKYTKTKITIAKISKQKPYYSLISSIFNLIFIKKANSTHFFILFSFSCC